MQEQKKLSELVDILEEHLKYDLEQIKDIKPDGTRIWEFRKLTINDLYNFKIYENACHINFQDQNFYCQNEMEFFKINLPEIQDQESEYYEEDDEEANNSCAAELISYIMNPATHDNKKFFHEKISLIRFKGVLSSCIDEEHRWTPVVIKKEQAVLLKDFLLLCLQDNVDQNLGLKHYVLNRDIYLFQKQLNIEIEQQIQANKKFKI